MGSYENELNKYAGKANESDIPRIDKDLGGMNKGPIKKIWDNVQALYKMIKDPNAAWGQKAIAIGALIYLISPIDLIPDVIPVVGLVDDAAVIGAAIAALGAALAKYKQKN